MSNFFISPTNFDIAVQISDMLNSYRQWRIKFNANAILLSNINYFIETNQDKVIACAGFTNVNNVYTKIQHVCTLPEYRNFGIAKKLINLCIDNSTTPMLCCNIRDDNVKSINLFKSLNFNLSNRVWSINSYLLVMTKQKNNKGYI